MRNRLQQIMFTRQKLEFSREKGQMNWIEQQEKSLVGITGKLIVLVDNNDNGNSLQCTNN